MSDFLVQVILEGDAAHLGDAINSIAAGDQQHAAHVRRQLAATLCQPLFNPPCLDPRIGELFIPIEPLLVEQIAGDDRFYCAPGHPLQQWLNSLLPAASHWFARDAKPSQQFYDKLNALLQTTATHWRNGETDNLQPLQEFHQWLGSEEKRAALLESRLCETELSTSKIVAAQTLVIDSLNHNLAQRPLPTELHSVIAQQLVSELQYWASNTPANELASQPLWKHWQRILPALGQLFSLGDIQVDDQLLYSQIPAIMTELERSISQPSSNTISYQQCVAQFNHCLMLAIQKQPQEISLFAPLPRPESQLNSNTKVPLALLHATEHIHVGDWILIQGDNNEPIRCKLALKNPTLDQLLFVDHTGRKVMSKSNKDFALCLSTGIAKPLPPVQLTQRISALLQALVERANRSVQAQLLQQKQKAEALVRAVIAKQQAELDARQAAAHKAMAEARVLADTQRRRTAEQAAEQERLQIEQAANQAAEAHTRQQAAMDTLNHLQVGAWLELQTLEGAVRAKLSVIIGATGKYIFADQVGRKLVEYSREQLLAQLLNGELKVLRNGDNFEDQLAKVIRGLRRDVN